MANAKSVTPHLNGFVPNKVIKITEELAKDTAVAAKEAMANVEKKTVEVLETLRPEVVPAERGVQHNLNSVPMMEDTVEETRDGYSRLNAIAYRIGKLIDGLGSKLHISPKEKVAYDAKITKQALFEQLANTDDLSKKEEIFGELHRLTDIQDAAKTTTPDEIELTEADIFDVKPMHNAEILDSTPVVDSNPFKTEADAAATDATLPNANPPLVLPPTLQTRISAMKSNFETLINADEITHTPARESIFSEHISSMVQHNDNTRIANENQELQAKVDALQGFNHDIKQATYDRAFPPIPDTSSQPLYGLSKEDSGNLPMFSRVVLGDAVASDPRLQPRPFIEIASDSDDITRPMENVDGLTDEITKPFARLDNLDDKTEPMAMQFDEIYEPTAKELIEEPVVAKKVTPPPLLTANKSLRLVSSNVNPTPASENGDTQRRWDIRKYFAWMRGKTAENTTTQTEQAVNM